MTDIPISSPGGPSREQPAPRGGGPPRKPPRVVTRGSKGRPGRPRKEAASGKPSKTRKHVDPSLYVAPVVEGKHPSRPHDGVEDGDVSIDYFPTPKQEIFSCAVKELMSVPGVKIAYICSGIRTGKTFALAYEGLNQTYVYNRTPNLAYVVTETGKLGRIPRRMVQVAAGDALVTEKRESDAGPAHMLFRPNAAIPDHYFVWELHSSTHADRMRGASVAFALFDEPQLFGPAALDVVEGRLADTDGILLMGGTATYAGHWTKTEVIDRAARCGKCGDLWYDHYDLKLGSDPDVDPFRKCAGLPERVWCWTCGGKVKSRVRDCQYCHEDGTRESRRYVPKNHEREDPVGDLSIAVIQCSTFDNIHLKRSTFEALRAKYANRDPAIVQRELYGKYAAFEGIIYKTYDRDKHRSTITSLTCPPEARLMVGIDWGIDDPFVALLIARVSEVYHIIGEYYVQDRRRSLKDHAWHIREELCKGVLNRVRVGWCDPSRPDNRREMQKFIPFRLSPARRRKGAGGKWVNFRIEIVNGLFMSRADEGGYCLRVNPETCPLTVRDLEMRKWKRYAVVGEDGSMRTFDKDGKEVDRNPGDDPAPGWDHGTDAAEYSIVSDYLSGYLKPKRHSSDAPAVSGSSRGKSEGRPNVSPEYQNAASHVTRLTHETIKNLTRPRKMGILRPPW